MLGLLTLQPAQLSLHLFVCVCGCRAVLCCTQGVKRAFMLEGSMNRANVLSDWREGTASQGEVMGMQEGRRHLFHSS